MKKIWKKKSEKKEDSVVIDGVIYSKEYLEKVGAEWKKDGLIR